MNKLYKYFSIISAMTFVLAIAYLLATSKVDNTTLNGVEVPKKMKQFSIENYLPDSKSVILEEEFPYRAFIDSASWWNEQTITNTLILLDSNRRNHTEDNEDILISCLSDSLMKYNFHNCSIDSLNMLLNISEKFLAYSEVNPERKFFYKSIANNWISYVTNHLSALVKTENSFKYSFKCRYLRERCVQLGFIPDFGNTSIEKVILNIADSNWHYLFIDRFWNATTLVFKLLIFSIIFVLLIILGYGLVCIFQKHSIKK
jgi:hypothetical protein